MGRSLFTASPRLAQLRLRPPLGQTLAPSVSGKIPLFNYMGAGESSISPMPQTLVEKDIRDFAAGSAMRFANPGDETSGSMSSSSYSVGQAAAAAAAPAPLTERRLRPCIFGSHAASLKGEDGLRVDRLTIGTENVTAALVVDGHGGHQAAALAIDNLLPLIAERARGDASSPSLQHAAAISFALLHERMRAPEFGSTAGTTVTLCMVNETRCEITCCSVGDSFGIFVAPPSAGAAQPPHAKLATTELTVNMRIEDNEKERERVRAAGGNIGKAASPDGFPYGPMRAWPGGITCASSLGDADCGAPARALVPPCLLASLPRCLDASMPR